VSALPPHLYEREGLARAVPPVQLALAAGRRAALEARGAYPLLTLGQLAHESGASYDYLREVVARRRDPYQSFEIPKRAGGTRIIAAPEPILMDVQRWVLSNILSGIGRHPASYAYQRGLSIVDCANRHRGARWLIKMDLHDFFGSVSETDVYKTYRRLGYDRLMAFELSRLSTRAPHAEYDPFVGDHYVIREYAVSASGYLPQGAYERVACERGRRATRPVTKRLCDSASPRLYALLG